MPSEKVLEQKKAKVEQLSEILKGAVSGVLVDYKGISVEADTKLRRELREAGVVYSVEKNSMLRFAVKNAGLDGLADVLEGTTALAVSTSDQTAPARIIGKYIEESKNETFKMKAGFVDGELYDAAKCVALSKIPSREALLSQLLGSLMSPMTSLAANLKALQEKLESEQSA